MSWFENTLFELAQVFEKMLFVFSTKRIAAADASTLSDFANKTCERNSSFVAGNTTSSSEMSL